MRRRYHELHGQICEVKCVCCGKSFKAPHHERKYCDTCLEKIRTQNSTGQYKSIKQHGEKHDEHRRIASELGVITKGHRDVVHHVDMDKSHNTLDNLLVLDIKNHNSLHAYLRENKIKYPEKSLQELTWEFIVDNEIPYIFCNDIPPELQM